MVVVGGTVIDARVTNFRHVLFVVVWVDSHMIHCPPPRVSGPFPNTAFNFSSSGMLLSISSTVVGLHIPIQLPCFSLLHIPGPSHLAALLSTVLIPPMSTLLNSDSLHSSAYSLGSGLITPTDSPLNYDQGFMNLHYHQPLHGSYRPPRHHHHHQWQHQQQCLTQQTMHVPGGPRAGGMGMGSLSATTGESDRTKQFFFQAQCVFSRTSTIRRPLTLFSWTTASLRLRRLSCGVIVSMMPFASSCSSRSRPTSPM